MQDLISHNPFILDYMVKHNPKHRHSTGLLYLINTYGINGMSKPLNKYTGIMNLIVDNVGNGDYSLLKLASCLINKQD